MALYHSAKGSNNYTVVGSPTIVDGVVSGFSQNDRITLPNLPSSKVEGVIKAHTYLSYTGDQYLFYSFYNYNTKQFGIRKTAEGKLRLWMGSDGVEISNIADNTDYWIKFYYYNGTASLSISTNGISYSTPVSFSVTDTPSTSFTGVRIGAGSSSSNYWYSSVDLSQTYIMVNEQPWFGVCPVEVQKHQIMGPVGYTVVGSPTISNGVVSGFTNSNYITVVPPTVTISLDIVIKYKLNTRTSFRSDLLQTTIEHGIVIRELAEEDNLAVYFNDGVRWTPVASTGVPVVLDTWSYIKLSWSGNNIIFYYSYDGRNWTQGATLSKDIAPSWGDGLVCFGGTARENQPLSNGLIDLNETYIKVNGKLWYWQPQETKKIMVNGVQVWGRAQ